MKKSVFKYYFKGSSNINKSFRKDSKLYLKAPLLVLSLLILLGSVILAPFALIFNNNLEREINNNQQLKLSSSFDNLSNEKIKNVFIIYLIPVALIISGALILTFIQREVLLILMQIEEFVNYFTPEEILIGSNVVLFSVILIYAVLVYLKFSYILSVELTLSNNTLKETFREAKKTFKLSSYFKSLLIVLLYVISLVVVLVAFIVILYFIEDEIGKLLYYTFNFMLQLIYLVYFSKTFLKLKQSLHLYYSDLMKSVEVLNYTLDLENEEENKTLINIFNEDSLE